MPPVTPRCPFCNAHGLSCLANQPVGAYLIVYCGQCGAIHGIIPSPKSPGRPRGEKEPRKSQPAKTVFEIIGRADVTNKQPYSPQKLAERARAASLNRGTMYMQITHDDGPPVCPHHKIDMKQMTVPAGYPNSGLKVWVCPQFEDCKEWELVDHEDL